MNGHRSPFLKSAQLATPLADNFDNNLKPVNAPATDAEGPPEKWIEETIVGAQHDKLARSYRPAENFRGLQT